MESINKEQSNSSLHYQKYYESTRRSQRKYYLANAEKAKLYNKIKYNNDPEFRQKKLDSMTAYRAAKKNIVYIHI
tara:strand:+ start:303 stop:527 length:225 start_codon:yes stop_codon:yes gene_type:complete